MPHRVYELPSGQQVADMALVQQHVDSIQEVCGRQCTYGDDWYIQTSGEPFQSVPQVLY